MQKRLCAFLTFFAIALSMTAYGDDPFDGPADPKVDPDDPFAAKPLTDRFRWKVHLSVNKSLLSGSDVVSKVAADAITLSSGNEFLIDEQTTFVHQSPGEPTTPASVSNITEGTPISFEIDLSRGAAARRIVVWKGFGPPGHKIYNDRLRKLLEPLQPTGVKLKQLTLQHPAKAMTLRCESTKKTIEPGEPELIRFDTPLEVHSGDVKEKIEFEKPTSQIVAFRSFGSRAMILTFE